MKVKEVKELPKKFTIEPKLGIAENATSSSKENDPLENLAFQWKTLMQTIKCPKETLNLENVNYVSRNLFVLVRDPHLQADIHDVVNEAKEILRTRPSNENANAASKNN